MKRPIALTVAFVALAIIQFLLYRSYIEREVAWNFVLRGDTNWYIFFSYRIFEAILNRDLTTLVFSAVTFPWGMVLFLESAFMQLVFGPSRFSVASVNLAHFLIAQWATFIIFRRISGSAWVGLSALLLLFSMQTPFRGDGPGLNITDFHFDLVFFYLFLLVIYLVALSDTFARRSLAIVIAVLAALTVATRIVSFFLLVGIFGSLFIYLLFQWWRRRGAERIRAGARALNLFLASLTFIALCAIPIGVARNAVFAHYFRFVFDPQFREDRQGLYTMGASVQAEAYELIRRMVAFDFSWPFAIALIALGGIVALGLWRRAAVAAGGIPQSSMDANASKTFVGFLVLAIIVSYGMHLVFPIKSDHLTRMTAAPILVLIMFLAAKPIARALDGRHNGTFAVSIAFVLLLAGVAAYVQLNFYSSRARLPITRENSQKVSQLYADMSRIVEERRLKAVSISTDKVTSFELGPLYSFYTYEYEKHGRLLSPEPRLGRSIDQPITFEAAVAAIDNSDFMLLLEDAYPTDPRWPMMKSIKAFHSDLQRHVRSRFCLAGTYQIEGQNNGLYVRPSNWVVTASASTEPRYGPQGLLGPGGVIWHAPWPGRPGGQWIEFAVEGQTMLTRLKMMAQDGGAKRAPRAFALEAADSSGTFKSILDVKDASFDDHQNRAWDIAPHEPASRYRVLITENNGDPTLLTLQHMQVETSRVICASVGTHH